MLSKLLGMICLTPQTLIGLLEIVGEALGEKMDILGWRCTLKITRNAELILVQLMAVDAKVDLLQSQYAENAESCTIIAILSFETVCAFIYFELINL